MNFAIGDYVLVIKGYHSGCMGFIVNDYNNSFIIKLEGVQDTRSFPKNRADHYIMHWGTPQQRMKNELAQKLEIIL